MKTVFKKVTILVLTFGLLISLSACGERKIKSISYTSTNQLYKDEIKKVIDEIKKAGYDTAEIKETKKELTKITQMPKLAKVTYCFDEEDQKFDNLIIDYKLNFNILGNKEKDKKITKTYIDDYNKDIQQLRKEMLKHIKKDKQFKKYRKTDFNLKITYDEKSNNVSFKLKANKTAIYFFINKSLKNYLDKKDIKKLNDLLNAEADEFMEKYQKLLKKEIKAFGGKKEVKDYYQRKIKKY